MQSNLLIHPMLAHVMWSALLYALLTVARAPTAWGIGAGKDGSNPWGAVEPRISANLRNQFEWPLLFYSICVLLMATQATVPDLQIWLAWLFIAGRTLHSGVQILSSNVRLRGLVFTINFVAVLGMWLIYYWGIHAIK